MTSRRATIAALMTSYAADSLVDDDHAAVSTALTLLAADNVDGALAFWLAYHDMTRESLTGNQARWTIHRDLEERSYRAEAGYCGEHVGLLFNTSVAVLQRAVVDADLADFIGKQCIRPFSSRSRWCQTSVLAFAVLGTHPATILGMSTHVQKYYAHQLTAPYGMMLAKYKVWVLHACAKAWLDTCTPLRCKEVGDLVHDVLAAAKTKSIPMPDLGLIDRLLRLLSDSYGFHVCRSQLDSLLADSWRLSPLAVAWIGAVGKCRPL
jgi:hypothetical protein